MRTSRGPFPDATGATSPTSNTLTKKKKKKSLLGRKPARAIQAKVKANNQKLARSKLPNTIQAKVRAFLSSFYQVAQFKMKKGILCFYPTHKYIPWSLNQFKRTQLGSYPPHWGEIGDIKVPKHMVTIGTSKNESTFVFETPSSIKRICMLYC